MSGNGLVVLMHDLTPEIEGEFNRWYVEFYGPRGLTRPGVLGVRRYRAILGELKYLALWEVADSTVPERPEFWQASSLNPEADEQSRRMNGHILRRVRGVYTRLATLPDPEPTDLSRALALLVRGHEVPPKHDEEFNDWYSTEHMVNLSRVEGFVRARRFKLVTSARDLIGNPFSYLTLYDLEKPEVQESEAWRRAVDTPWSARIRPLISRRLASLHELIYAG